MSRYRIAFYVDSVPFTKGVISGNESLGGSESACLGLARALARSGHSVTIYATKLDDACVGIDPSGVQWDKAEALRTVNRYLEWDVFVALRMYTAFAININARLRVLWNQDLLLPHEGVKQGVMAHAWALDKIAYVSQFHRTQWERGLPELAPVGWVTRNGFDPSLVPTDAVKNPNQIIHISRPERGLRPLLTMWPAFKAAHPEAELVICRYNSMYDAGGWGEVCKSYDAAVTQVNDEVGGIRYLGELGKPALYRAIAESAVMWYPGVSDFAETSCIAAIESQACGTPFVGSYKGALPETVPHGVLLKGDADKDAAYQNASMAAVASFLRGCRDQTAGYRGVVKAGEAHVSTYTYDYLAREWSEWVDATFRARYEQNQMGVLRRLLREDDHTAALIVARNIAGDPNKSDRLEAFNASELCERVIAGKEHTSEQYAEHALDVDKELDLDYRFKAVAETFAGAASMLDVACGNGSAAITFALAHPTLHVHGIDYAAGNIAQARKAAEKYGVFDRVTFACLPVWDFDSNAVSVEFSEFALAHAHSYDALFCGEFIEHVADCTGLVDALETTLTPNAAVVFTCPSGNGRDLLDWRTPLHRGHVHRFATDDLLAVFGAKPDMAIEMLGGLETPRSGHFGNWVVSYRYTPGVVTGQRPYQHRIVTTRPMSTVTAGILANNAEFDLGKCLSSIWMQVDEIIVGDTGSHDDTKVIAAKFGARVLDLANVDQQEDGFSGARNAILDAATGDWFLWVDTDEVVLQAQSMSKYLDATVYNGYVIRQNHLMLDAPTSFDTPVRIFRTHKGIRFYGCIHEQPQMGHCNGDIAPVLDIVDCQIAHTGYLTEAVRRWKMMKRNLPLLVRDMKRFPERELGKVLLLRDYVNLAQHELEHSGQLSSRAKGYLTQGIGVFEKFFRDPAHKLHQTARPYYDMALKLVAGAVEVEIGIAGRAGGMGQAHAKPSRMWVRDVADLEREVQHRVSQIRKQMVPEPLLVDPFEETPAAQEAAHA